MVPVGHRDIVGHVIACQMARIFRPETLYREIIAAVRPTLVGRIDLTDASHAGATGAREYRRFAHMLQRRAERWRVGVRRATTDNCYDYWAVPRRLAPAVIAATIPHLGPTRPATPPRTASGSHAPAGRHQPS
jgi:hypothetical protein